ncbi:Meiotic chromosome segregation protein [Paramyrothecium foliicola]|nr:Meiotic chromosome segregation protein [Paramyrothecium foliicola]
MNNEQFRKLIKANSDKSGGLKNAGSPSSSSSGGGAALGSRQRASIPMTPRSVGGSQSSFARQLAERQQATHSQKKFKASAPRGVKLASGYVDRAKDREESTADSREERLKNLEELYKKEEIDRETFEKLRYEIAGGDLESTHLVKGLDFKLLERIRKGEDVYTGKDESATEKLAEAEPDVDDELDQLEERDVQAIEKDKTEKKKGQLSTVTLASSKKRTRDQILAELKAARLAAKAQQEPALGDRFRRIGAKQKPGSRIERDSKGREVLIIVDEDGHEKRKVRKVQHDDNREAPSRNDLLMPDKDAKPLGMEVPEQYRKEAEPEEESDVDIFEGVGDDYDPLAGMDDASSDSEDEANKEPEAGGETTAIPGNSDVTVSSSRPDESMAPPPKPTSAPAARNYFQGSKTGLISAETSKTPSMSDPAIMAAIKRAAALKAADHKDEGDEDEDGETQADSKAREERRKRLLQANDRDDYDLDMGFGTSRFEDEEDLGDEKVKLSAWGDEDDGSSRGGKSQKRKRTRKRKGDANNADDILRVIEQRKKSS